MEEEGAGSSSASAAGGDAARRATASYAPHHSRFLLRDRKYTLQYSHIYTNRLALLKPFVLSAVSERWGVESGRARVCPKIVDLLPGEGAQRTLRPWVVCGCIYKEMTLKPSVLDTYSGDRAMTMMEQRANYTSPSDALVLEDDSGRVLLTALPSFPLAALTGALVTGVVVAVRGTVTDSGELEISALSVPGLGYGALPTGGPPAPLPLPAPARGAQPVYALLLSGLGAGSPGVSAPLPLQLLAEWVSGAAEEGGAAPRVARCIIAGGLVGPAGVLQASERTRAQGKRAASAGGGAGGSAASSSSSSSASASTSYTDARLSTQTEQDAVVISLRDADAYLAQLLSAVACDLMPGEGDPASLTLPQLPLHHTQLPLSACFSSLNSVTNPYEAEVEGVRFLGCSGQNISDIARYTSSSSVMDGEEGGCAWGGSSSSTSAGAGAGAGAGAASASASASASAARASGGEQDAEIAAAVAELAREGAGAGGGGRMRTRMWPCLMPSRAPRGAQVGTGQ